MSENEQLLPVDVASGQTAVSPVLGAAMRLPYRGRRVGVFVFLFVVVMLFGAGSVSGSSQVIPTMSIVSVVPNESVQVQTHNYPTGQIFTVRMNYMGTLGIGGEVVGSFDSSRGDMAATYAVPEFLKGQRQIAIRMDSNQGYYTFNWFWNDAAGAGGQPTPPEYTGIPTISINSVAPGVSVTLTTNNFPPNQVFDVTQGLMGTAGVNGIKVGEINSGDGSAQTVTFGIPAELAAQTQIAIRAQTRHANPFYAFNWFWNVSTGTGGQPTPPVVTPPVTGIPTIQICSVVRDQQIVFQTANYPANMNFTVTMGPMFTQGLGGAISGTFNSGAGGTLRQTMPIPNEVKGLDQISLRVQGSPQYSYNWFWNTTTSVDFCN